MELLMPRLADAMEEGTILKWLVAVGDSVGKGQAIVEIETDKASTTYDSELEGIVAELLAAEGDTVAVGRPIARFDGRAKGAASSRPQPAAAKGAVEVLEPTRTQQAVGRRAAESKATVPDYFVEVDIDMTACTALRERLREIADPLPSFNDIVVKAAANALREFPRVNGAYRDGRFERFSRVNVGIAVSAGDELVVPTLLDADQASLGEIARRSRAVIARARAGEISPPELSGATFTVVNYGTHGVARAGAVIAPPQAAVLTVGTIAPRPIVDEYGRIVSRQLMAATLTCDQRIVFGAEAAAFLGRVRELLETTAGLAL